MPLVFRKTKWFKLLSAWIALALIFSALELPEAQAARKRAGGGKLTDVDWLDGVFKPMAITIGTAVVFSALSKVAEQGQAYTATRTLQDANGAFIGTESIGMHTGRLADLSRQGFQTGSQILPSGAIMTTQITQIPTSIFIRVGRGAAAFFSSSCWSEGLMKAFDGLGGVGITAIRGYNAYFVTSQVGRAVGAIGSYHGWNPDTIFLVSSVANGGTAGFLNPSAALGDSLSMVDSGGLAQLRGFAVGAVGGLASAGVTVAIDGDKINQGQSPGFGAQIAGLAAGTFATELGRIALNPRTYGTVIDKYSWGKANEQEWIIGDGKIMTKDQWGNITGIKSAEDELRRLGMHSMWDHLDTRISALDIQDLLVSEHTQVNLDAEGNATVAVAGKRPMEIQIDQPGVRLLESTTPAPDNGLYAPRFSVKGGSDSLLTRNEMVHFLNDRGFCTQGMSPTELRYYAQTFGASVGSIEFAQPKSGLIASRILLQPFVRLADMWPQIAAQALTIWATKDMDSTWKPVAYLSLSTVAGSALEGLAMTYALKPAYWGTWQNNIDTKCGLCPTGLGQREQFFGKAAGVQLASRSKGTPAPAELLVEQPDVNTPAGARKFLSKTFGGEYAVENMSDRDVILTASTYASSGFMPTLPAEEFMSEPEVRGRFHLENMSTQEVAKLAAEKGIQVVQAERVILTGIKLTEAREVAVLSSVLDSRRTAIRATGAFTDRDFKEAQFNAIKNVKQLEMQPSTVTYTVPGPQEQLRAEIAASAAGNVAPKPLSFSEVIPGKSNLEIYRDLGGTKLGAFGLVLKNSLRDELPMAALSGLMYIGLNQIIKKEDASAHFLSSLAAVAATSVARGIAVNRYSKYAQNQTIASINQGKFDPQMVAWRTPNNQAEIMLGYASGEIPIPQMYSFSDPKFKQGEREVSVEEVRSKLAVLNSNLACSDITLEVWYDPSDLKKVEPIGGIVANYQKSVNAYKEAHPDYSNPNLETSLAELSSIDYVTDELIPPQPGKEQFPLVNHDLPIGLLYAVKVDGNTQIVPNLQLANVGLSKEFRLRDGQISESSQYKYYEYDAAKQKYIPTNKRVEVYPVACVPTLSTSILENLNQGFSEVVWQTFAMGLPHTKEGKLSSYAWNNYRDNLSGLANSAQQKGVFPTMIEHGIDVMKGTSTSSGIIQNYLLTGLADIPLGKNEASGSINSLGKIIGISNNVAISGYKGMPYSEVIVSEGAFRSATALFYPQWPYYRISPFPRDSFAQYIRFARSSRTTQAEPEIGREIGTSARSQREKILSGEIPQLKK